MCLSARSIPTFLLVLGVSARVCDCSECSHVFASIRSVLACVRSVRTSS